MTQASVIRAKDIAARFPRMQEGLQMVIERYSIPPHDATLLALLCVERRVWQDSIISDIWRSLVAGGWTGLNDFLPVYTTTRPISDEKKAAIKAEFRQRHTGPDAGRLV